MRGRNGERGSGISALAARHDDDDDDGKMNGGIMSPSLVTTLNTIIWTGFLVFINMTMNLSLN